MAEIKCPQCGTVISLEQTDLDSVVKQVRDEEFQRELEERMQLMQTERDQAVKLAVAQEHSKLQAAAQEKDAHILQLQAQLEQSAQAHEAQQQLAVAQVQSRMKDEVQEKDAQILQLKAQLEQSAQTHETQQQLAVAQAVAAAEKERDALKAAVELKEMEKTQMEVTLKEQMIEQGRLKDQQMAALEDEIERIKDMRSKLSTKMIGETLEQHCQYEFDRIRATAFPAAYFEKDNDASQGSKGDFIFREEDEDGNEVISIMFEMKNLSESDSVKKRNEDHFAKLDRDRTQKGCEYAVLVSLLEPESELYNEGIVDVSHRYPKMYVVRPQFFIPIISLLRNASLGALKYKRELALVRQQELDITNFEHDLDVFKQGFFKNFGDASKRFEDAVAAIDKAIADLQKAKDKLLVSEKHLKAANNKLDGLTVKKLTRNNPTMKEKFSALEAAAEDAE